MQNNELAEALVASILRTDDYADFQGTDMLWLYPSEDEIGEIDWAKIEVSIEKGGDRQETESMAAALLLMATVADEAYAYIKAYDGELAFAISVPGEQLRFWTYREAGACAWEAPRLQEELSAFLAERPRLAGALSLRGFQLGTAQGLHVKIDRVAPDSIMVSTEVPSGVINMLLEEAVRETVEKAQMPGKEAQDGLH